MQNKDLENMRSWTDMDDRMTKYDKYIFRRDKKEQERSSGQRE